MRSPTQSFKSSTMGRPKGSKDTPLGIQAGIIVLHMFVGLGWEEISTLMKVDPLTAKKIWEKVEVQLLKSSVIYEHKLIYD